MNITQARKQHLFNISGIEILIKPHAFRRLKLQISPNENITIPGLAILRNILVLVGIVIYEQFHISLFISNLNNKKAL
jgi:hypothetical protein